MPNRLKQLPLNVQKWVYEIAGMAGTIYGGLDSEAYNYAMGAFLFTTAEELQDFLFDHARYNLEHRISWYDAIQKAYKTPRQGRVYREYLRSQNGSGNAKSSSTVPCDPLSLNRS